MRSDRDRFQKLEAVQVPPQRLGQPRRASRANSPWFASSLKFQAALTRGLDYDSEFRRTVRSSLRGTTRPGGRDRVWVLTHPGLDVPSRPDPVPVTIEFHESPTYDTFGLDAEDFPLILADPGQESPHRHGNDALCLWFPGDPAEKRWHHTDGLVALYNLARNHLFFETHWRATGGHGGPGQTGGEWLGDEAAHGYYEALMEVS